MKNQSVRRGHPMQVDIAGRVKNLQLPLTQPLIPLFECLVNSVEAIEELGIPDGQVTVLFERDSNQGILSGVEDGSLLPVHSVSITDNGSGFNDANARAFLTSDSTGKASLGNKGIGRFTWLKVFDRAEVDSVFLDGGDWLRRTFNFVRTSDGIAGEKIEEASTDGSQRKTVVRLLTLRPEYQKHFPKSIETIARRIIDHLLARFVAGTCPRILLLDESGSSVDLNKLYASEAEERAKVIEVVVKNNTFSVTVLRYHSASEKFHTVSYCANQREVQEWKASKVIPEMASRFNDDDGQQFVFKTYVSGAYLDERVNSERTDFMFLPEEDIEFPSELTKDELDSAVSSAIRQVAGDYISALQKDKRETIESFVQDKAPQFRPVLQERHKSKLERIPVNITEDQLDVELYKVARDIEVEHRQLASKLGAIANDSPSRTEEYDRLMEEYLDDENELGKAALARYVVHRRSILELLDRSLKIQESGAYAREDFVHRLIFPMRATSDEVNFEDQNLWVVDERLAYHSHLASDIPFSQLKAAAVEGADRADVVVFNKPRAFTDTSGPYQSVVILEFKRPERNEYAESDGDPVAQVLRYVEKIKSGTAKDKDGKTINVGQIPFYGYILCSLTPRMRSLLEGRDFTETADGEGYFQYHKNHGCYIEVLSYDKVLNDSKKRNRAFFERLQIPMR